MRFFDLHCDTLYRIVKEREGLYQNNFEVSIVDAKIYKPWIQSFAIWIPDNIRGKEASGFFKECINSFDNQMQSNAQYIEHCKTRNDLRRVVDSLKNGAILTIEGGAALAGSLDNLYLAHKHGVRAITLTWNGRCELGDGVGVENSMGLSDFGKDVIREMEKLDISVDLSHASDKLFEDVMKISSKSVIATHSNSREICNNKRNLTREQFEFIRDNGGIVGINFNKDFLNLSSEVCFIDILKHIDYFLGIGGEKCICIGSDFDGADLPDKISGIKYIKDLYEFCLSSGYKQNILDDIFFNNAYNFYV